MVREHTTGGPDLDIEGSDTELLIAGGTTLLPSGLGSEGDILLGRLGALRRSYSASMWPLVIGIRGEGSRLVTRASSLSHLGLGLR